MFVVNVAVAYCVVTVTPALLKEHVCVCTDLEGSRGRQTHIVAHRAAETCVRHPSRLDEAPPAQTVHLRRYSPPPTARNLTHSTSAVGSGLKTRRDAQHAASFSQ